MKSAVNLTGLLRDRTVPQLLQISLNALLDGKPAICHAVSLELETRQAVEAINPSRVCDNCHKPCQTVRQDSTMIAMTEAGDRPFHWGVECPCGIARGW